MTKQQYDLLTLSERSLFDAFVEVKGENTYTVMIDWICSSGSAEDFRTLISELKEDAHDNPSLMKQILGESTYQQLIKLKPLCYVYTN